MAEGFFERIKEERIEKRLLKDLEELELNLDNYNVKDQEEIKTLYNDIIAYDDLVANIGDKLIYPRVNPEKYYEAKVKAALLLAHFNINEISQKDIEEISLELVDKIDLTEKKDIEKIKELLEKNKVDFETFKNMYKKL